MATVMVVTVMVVMVVNCMFTVMPVSVEAIGMAAQSIGMGMPIGMVAIGMDVAIGIGGTVDGGPMVLALVGEWFLAVGFGSVTDTRRAIGDSNDADTASRMPLDLQIGPSSMAVFGRNGGVGRRGRRMAVHPPLEDREFVFIEDKLTEIERQIGELRSTASGQG